MKKSIKTLALALATLGLVSACTIGGKSSNPASSASGSDSGSQSSSASQSGSDSSSSSSSSQAGITLDEVLALAVQKAAAKKAKVNIPDYRDMEYLGPNTAVYTYLGTYASNGSVYYFVNEQGYFAYQYAGGELSLKSFDLDPTIDLYSDVLYTPYDIINSNLSGASATLVEETESAFVADLVLTDDMKASLASLIGYGASYYSYVTATRMTISKDANTIDFDVTFNGASELAYVTNFGTHENAEAIAFIEAIPPYEPVVEWPAADITAAFAAKGEPEFAVPALTGEGFSYVVDTTTYSSFIDITVNGAGADDLLTYKGILETAGWTVSGSGSSYTAKKEFTQGIGKIAFANSSSYGFYIDIYYVMDPLPAAAFPAEALAAAFEALGVPAFTIPGPDGEGYTYEYQFDEGNLSYLDYPSWCYDDLKINNMSQEQFDTYRAKLGTNGWEEEVSGSYYYYTKHFETEKLTAQIRLSYAAATSIATMRIYYVAELDPLPEWPTADVAELFTEYGDTLTDVLPALEGYPDATYTVFDDAYGKGVTCFVGEENQDAALVAYAATLVAAKYTYDDVNEVYTSEHGEIVVSLEKGTDGAIVINASLGLFAGFLGKHASAFLTSRGVTTVELPNFSALEASAIQESAVWDDSGWYYPCYQVIFDGNCVSTILGILTTAEWEVPATAGEYGYECFDPTGTVEIDVDYDEDDEVTSFTVYSYADLA